MDLEEKRQRAMRAAEVINEAGWAFDEYVAAQQTKWMNSKPEEQGERETAYHRAQAALEIKLGLAAIINTYQGEQVLNERREQRNPE